VGVSPVLDDAVSAVNVTAVRFDGQEADAKADWACAVLILLASSVVVVFYRGRGAEVSFISKGVYGCN